MTLATLEIVEQDRLYGYTLLDSGRVIGSCQPAWVSLDAMLSNAAAALSAYRRRQDQMASDARVVVP